MFANVCFGVCACAYVGMFLCAWMLVCVWHRYLIDHDIERFEKSVVIESFLPRTVKWLAQLCPIMSEKIKQLCC